MPLTKSQLERRAALVRLDAEEARCLVVEAQRSGDLASYMGEVLRLLEEIGETLDLPLGLRVEQVAQRLGVSKPTVKKWLDEGLLERVPDRSPIELTQDSVLRVERILKHVREHYPARSWTEQLAALLHDRDLQQQDWFREGVEQGRRGEYVKL